VIPTLQRFYGGDPRGWLSMPIALLNAYLAMLPRLQNQEALQQYEVLSLVALPQSKEEQRERRRIHSELRRTVERQQPAPRRAAVSPEQQLERLGALGFEVVR
jgi:hypothetical protein